MLEQLFKYEWALQKHLSAPMLREREAYLSELQARSFTKKRLCEIDGTLIRFIDAMGLSDDDTYDVKFRIDAIYDACKIMFTDHNTAIGKKQQQTLFNTCFEWLDFLGLVDERYDKNSFLARIYPYNGTRLKQLLLPLLAERIDYLIGMSLRGVSTNSIHLTGNFLAHIVTVLKLDITNERTYTIEDINNAIQDVKISKEFSQRRAIAFKWLDSLGLLDKRYSQDSLVAQLLPDASARIRFASYPFLDERIAHLEQGRSQMMAESSLRERANFHLHVIDGLKLYTKRTILLPEIEAAAVQWNNQPRTPEKLTYGNTGKNRFLHNAKNWLTWIGCYVPDEIHYHERQKVEQYLTWILRERGLSEHTVVNRRSQLIHFMTYLQNKKIALASLTPADIDEHISVCHDSGKFGRHGIHSRLCAIKGFVKYASTQSWCSGNIGDSILSPRMYDMSSVPSFVPDENIRSILKKAANSTGRGAKRAYAILLLLVTYGFRRSEVVNLKLQDIDWRNELIHLTHSKVFTKQDYPITQPIGDAIIDYIRNERNNSINNEYLFLGLSAPYKQMSAGSVYCMITSFLRGENIDIRHYGPHSLRHSFATRMINSDKTMKEVADMLGHQNISSSNIYAKVDFKSLQSVSDMNWEGLL